MTTYFFYDIETTGLNKAFDQVLQFAAIRTDMELNEIERHSIMIQLRPDVIISPRALITHRISISDTMNGLCEYDGIREIHRLMNEPDTISLGYNTLGFDDEFLRFSFYRNLLPPYTHQYLNGCRRMDLLPVTTIYYLFKRGVLSWPEVSGRPTLKLEHLSSFNDLATGQAHDAMVDVKATVELTRRLMKEKEMWDYLTAYFEKGTDKSRLQKLPVLFDNTAAEHRYGLMIGTEFGYKQQFQSPVLSMGNSTPYSNQTLWLRLDQQNLRDTTDETIAENTWVIRKREGEPGIILPPSERYLNSLSQERRNTVEENSRWLQSHPELFQKIIHYHREFSYAEIPDLDADAALYQAGFMSREDEALCRQYHEVSLAGKSEIATQFSSRETRTLASRLPGRNFKNENCEALAVDFDQFLKKVNPVQEGDALLDYKGEKRTTPSNALAEISKLRSEAGLDWQQRQLLDELENDINNKFPPVGAQGVLF